VLLLGEGVGVGAECQLGVCVTELVRHPPHALARGQRQAGVGVPGRVEAEGADAVLWTLRTLGTVVRESPP
jgi:hypothetical protein